MSSDDCTPHIHFMRPPSVGVAVVAGVTGFLIAAALACNYRCKQNQHSHRWEETVPTLPVGDKMRATRLYVYV